MLIMTTICSYTLRCTQYDRLSQQQLSFLFVVPAHFNVKLPLTAPWTAHRPHHMHW